MRRTRLTMVVLVTVGALLLVSISAVSAHPIKPVRTSIEYAFTGVWEGPIEGDIEGCAVSSLLSAVFPGGDPTVPPPPGNTEHFVGQTVISSGSYPDDCDGELYTIVVEEKGVWSLNTQKYRTTGTVISATGDYAYLEGARIHGLGQTFDFQGFPPPTDGSVTATQTLRFN